MAEIAPYYDALLDLASDELAGPVQTRLHTWEDGEFLIHVFHGYGPHKHRPGVTYRQTLRYHSGEDEVVKGLMAVDTTTQDKTLIHREILIADGVDVDASRSREKIGDVAGGD
jgi:hypothetical protein